MFIFNLDKDILALVVLKSCENVVVNVKMK